MLNEHPRFLYAVVLNENLSGFFSTHTSRIRHYSAKMEIINYCHVGMFSDLV